MPFDSISTGFHAGEYIDVSTIGMEKVPKVPANLPAHNPTQSYWIATSSTCSDHVSSPSSSSSTATSDLSLPQSCDVAIIGSGITGVSCAYHLAHTLPQNSTICILEARQFCSGATGRNGGHLTAVSALAYTDLSANPNHLLKHHASTSISPTTKASLVATEVGKILEFESRVAQTIKDLIREDAAESEVGFTDQSNWHLCFTQEEVDAFEDSLKAAQDAGLGKTVGQVRRVSREEIDDRMDHPKGIQAAYEIPGATLHPRRLVSLIYRLALRKAKQRNVTIRLFTETPVTAIQSIRPSNSADSTATASTLITERGSLEARYIVHATNAYVSHLLPTLSGATDGVVPTRAQVVAVSPIQPTRYWPMGISAGGGYEYGHQRPPPSPSSDSPDTDPPQFILGGGREHSSTLEWGIDDDSTLSSEVTHFLHPWLSNLFPRRFREEDVTMEWTGIMGYTKTKDPIVGPLDQNKHPAQYVAVGYSGHGMTRAFGCAEVVAQMITAREKGIEWHYDDHRDTFPKCYLTSEAFSGV